MVWQIGQIISHLNSREANNKEWRLPGRLVNQPRILLADEPTGNLDSRTSVEVMEIFQKLNADGLTIVLVTHEPDIAQFAKREIVFRDGQIRRDDVVKIPHVASEVLKTMPTIRD